MTAITDTRKRSRDEDSCDFMPISKRINSLSINNPFVGDIDISSSIIQQPEPNALANHHHQQFGGQHNININQFNSNYSLVNGNHMMVNNNNQLVQQQHSHNHANNNYMSNGQVNYNGREPDAGGGGGGGRHGNAGSTQQEDEDMGLESYCPELTQEENPFYYNKNKLLFDLHIERQRRHHTN